MTAVLYKPAEDVLDGRVGRKLDDTPATHDDAMDALIPGEHLYAGGHVRIYAQVYCVDSPEHFTMLRERAQQSDGNELRGYTLFALSEDDHRRALDAAIS